MNDYSPPALRDPKLPDGQHSFGITDPAVAIAVSKCWLSRQPHGTAVVILPAHPRCGWCDYDAAILITAVNSFWRQPGSERENRGFRSLAPSVQSRLVREAAGIETDR